MKIKKSIVEQIIKEEAVKVKKLISLNEEKKVILKQLNELYEEQPEEEPVMEEDSILSLIPDPKDQQIAQQDIQQAQQTGQQATPTTLEEEMLSEAMGGVLGKLQNLLLGKLKAQNPEGFEQAADAVGQKYANASYADIFKSVKAAAQPVMEEAVATGKKTMTKDEAKSTVEKVAGKVGSALGIAAPITYFASAMWTAATGTGFGIPSILGMASGGLLAAAVVAGLIYLLAVYYKQKKQQKPAAPAAKAPAAAPQA